MAALEARQDCHSFQLQASAKSAELWQHDPLIVAGTSPPIWIDLGKYEPGMILQRQERKRGMFVWCDVLVDGEVVKSPVDIDSLPLGHYQLV